VIFKDDSGKIVGGQTTYTNDIKPGSTAVFEASLYSVPDNATKYDLYIIGW